MIGYTDEAELEGWALARGIALEKPAATLLTLALDWVEVQKFMGSKADSAQSLQWPRSGVTIDNLSVDDGVLPPELISLQLRIAADIDAGMDPSGQRTAAVASETVFGAVAVTYADGSTDSVISTQAQALLNKLRGSAYGYNQFTVSRG